MSVFNDRKYVVMAIFVAICLIFIARLFYIQVFNDDYKLSANNNVLRYVTDYPARGLVYDRNGKLLVYNEAAYDLMVTPKQVKNLDTMELCNIIGMTKQEFIKKITTARQYSPYKASVLAAQLSNSTYATLQEKLYTFRGFYVQSRTLRKYPTKIAGHTFGYVGEASEKTIEKDPYYKSGDYIGISGIEKAYEKELRGKKGLKILMVDVFNRIKGHFKEGKYDTLSVTGANLISTIDADLQAYGEKLFQNKTGGLVAIDPKTGEILACISAPGYDPNLLVGRERSKNYYKLLTNPLQPLFNRALMAYYPPGSTFKLVNDLIALKEGVLTPEKTYPCPGGYHMATHTVKCDGRHGSINLRPAIQHSCNTYHCYVFRSIVDNPKFGDTQKGYQNWREHVLKFGVGKKLYSDLPQELKGNVPSIDYYDKVFGKNRWRSSTVVSLGIGQGELGITPLQMANIMAIIANKGYYHTPHIIKKIGNSDEHSKIFLKKNYTGIEKEYYDMLYDGMQDVLERGTAAGSRVKGINILGKTGTAQNPHGKDHSLFVAFAPRENPKIAIGLMIENGGWGASWAAPIGTLMIEKYLNDTIARKDLEKRMFEGVVYPPHYKVGMENEEPEKTKKDTLKTSKTKMDAAKNGKSNKGNSKDSLNTKTKAKSSTPKDSKGIAKKPSLKKEENGAQKNNKGTDSNKENKTKKDTLKSSKVEKKNIKPKETSQIKGAKEIAKEDTVKTKKKVSKDKAIPKDTSKVKSKEKKVKVTNREEKEVANTKKKKVNIEPINKERQDTVK